MVCMKDVENFHVLTPIGEILIKACTQGLHFLHQSEEISDENFTPMREQKVAMIGKISKNQKIQTHVEQSILWLTRYFEDPNANTVIPDICISSENGSFQERVWISLAKNVGSGQTVSYGELARMANSPGASQAVGTAMATNPIQIIVPCHRVIRSDGSLGQYSRGKRNNVKLWLLEHEGLKIINNKIMKGRWCD